MITPEGSPRMFLAWCGTSIPSHYPLLTPVDAVVDIILLTVRAVYNSSVSAILLKSYVSFHQVRPILCNPKT